MSKHPMSRHPMNKRPAKDQKNWDELNAYSERFVKRTRFIIGFVIGVFCALVIFARRVSGWLYMADYWYVSIPVLIAIGIAVGIGFNTVWKKY